MRLTRPTAIVLDTSPLSLVTQRPGHIDGNRCRAWYASLLAAGHRFFIPEVADYEHRREMLRTRNTEAVMRLDTFGNALPDVYVILTTIAVRRAAELWAVGRQIGRATSDPHASDADALICAQSLTLSLAYYGLSNVIVAPMSLLPRKTCGTSYHMHPPNCGAISSLRIQGRNKDDRYHLEDIDPK